MEKTIIQWNVYNWITIVLMASVGFAVIGMIGSLYRQYTNGGTSQGDA